MSAKAKSSLTPEQRKATLRRVLEKIRPYRFFVGCSLIVAAVSVAAQLYIPILCGSAIDRMLGKGRVDFAGVMQIIVQIVAVDTITKESKLIFHSILVGCHHMLITCKCTY